MNMKRTLPFVLGALLVGAYVAAPAWAADSSDTSAATSNQASSQISSRYATLSGSQGNADALVAGLRSGGEITLTAADGTTSTIQPSTGAMGYGEVNTTLALAQAELSAQGITEPTADQLNAALNGGSVTLSDGTTANLQGILALRSGGEGWGQIANDLGVNLGSIVSGSHTANSQAGLHGSSDRASVSTGDTASADASAAANSNDAGLQGQDRANANIAAHDTMGNVAPNVPNRPDVPTHPDVPDHPSIPSHPDLPDVASGHPGG
jgi:hypothetical protein